MKLLVTTALVLSTPVAVAQTDSFTCHMQYLAPDGTNFGSQVTLEGERRDSKKEGSTIFSTANTTAKMESPENDIQLSLSLDYQFANKDLLLRGPVIAQKTCLNALLMRC